MAGAWDPIADEAYHWTWSRALALGYYDQPPLIAWTLAASEAALGSSPLAMRAVGVCGWAAAVALLAPFARRKGAWGVWCFGLAPFAVLTLLAVPDALLLALWAVALAGAARGGRGWWGAGVAAGFAAMSKYTGLVLLPLLIAGARPEERRTRDPWIAVAIAAAIAAPNLWWNTQHGFVSVRFQVAEGLWHPHAPGAWGPLRQLGEQLLVIGPVAALAGVAWIVGAARRWGRLDRIDRLCLATSAPVLALFALAAIGGPPEAHWPAPAWIGVGLGLARAGRNAARAACVGACISAIATGALIVHATALLPWIPKAIDPATRLTEGRALAHAIAARVDIAGPPEIVFAERYQEASLIAWHAARSGWRIEATTLPGCGREDQFDLRRGSNRAGGGEHQDLPLLPLPPTAWFVRPSTGGPPTCVAPWYDRIDGPERIAPTDGSGRSVGPWDLFSLAGPSPDHRPRPIR